ncbi:hypothetical protein L1049_011821 [Liquidambar formosana]|uniref:Pectinesterase inhibitor domain-containing protein n=1 Tax=Liquidambar formosana TaxID=63359 RepID=A0AAP0RSM8_LIQFO
MGWINVVMVLVFCISLFSPFIPHTKATARLMDSNENLIQEWCRKTTHDQLCLSWINSDPRTSLKSEPKGFGVILTDLAKAKATSTSSHIAGLLKNTTDNATRNCLTGCSDGYASVMQDLDVNFELLDAPHYLPFASGFYAAKDKASDCEACFEGTLTAGTQAAINKREQLRARDH